MGYEIQLKTVRNLTSGVELLPKSDRFIEVSEFGPNDLTCDLPKVRVAAGQLVSISGRISFGDQTQMFDATGKIESSEAMPDGAARVHIVLRQFDKDLWSRFQDGLRRRQEGVTRLLMTMKGEES